MSDRVTTKVSEGVADVRLNRPDKRNALDGEMFLALAAAGEELKTMPGVRVVVLSGAGTSFCAGLDFSMFERINEREPGGARRRGDPTVMQRSGVTHLGQQVAWVWQELPMPVIAAVHGHALGGGFQIALGTDIRIVHPDTQLSVREVHWGLVPDMTATLLLSQVVRMDVAKELTFTARVFSGVEAGELGLATRVSDTPLEDAMALAAEIASRSPAAVRGSKALLNRALREEAVVQLAEERRIISELIGGSEQIEAVTANLEKRPPRFGAR